MTTSEQYRALREAAALGAVADRASIGVTGKDRLTYLQGLLTNDVAALAPGAGCYAAWLTPQGRMLTDIHLLESGDMLLLDVPAAELPATLQRLDEFLFGEDVQFADLSSTLTAVWLHGPSSASVLERVLGPTSGLATWPEYRNSRATFGSDPVVVARISQLGVPGFCTYIAPARSAELQLALLSAGAVEVGREVMEALRIEAGYPLFGTDMTTDTIPLEAGIEGRAISLTKGCYVGQEVIIRILHRGHGRVARRLMALRVDGERPVASSRILSDDKDVGWVTSAAVSPRLGTVALGYVHRDLAQPGSTVTVDTPSGRAAAVVSDRPLE